MTLRPLVLAALLLTALGAAACTPASQPPDASARDDGGRLRAGPTFSIGGGGAGSTGY